MNPSSTPPAPAGPTTLRHAPTHRAAADFSGVWTPLVTPFYPGDETIDHAALGRLARRVVAAGLKGLVACGTTSEAFSLSQDEQLAVLHTLHTAAPGTPLILGVSGYHLGEVLDWVRVVNDQPVPLAGLLVSAPHYCRPAQAGLRQWFERIADASRCPLVVYDIPYRTGATLTLDTLRALAEHPHIRAIKDCGGDAAKTQALIHDGRLQVLAGEDHQVLATMALGGAGAIAACAQVHTARWVDMVQRIQAGDLPAARAHWQVLAPLVQALFAEPNPAPLKALLAAEGHLHNLLRLPMTPAGEAAVQRALAASRAVGADAVVAV